MTAILYISPHPDDECLSMGMSIANHIWNGYDVHIALMTHGGKSDAINTINGNNYCDWHETYHNPAYEGYEPLSIEGFTTARVEEFKYSVLCLGVKPENILIYDYEDGNLSKDDVKKVIEDFLDSHPGAYIKTTSYFDIHEDHKACGNALLELYNSGRVSDARFYISPFQWEDTPGYFEENLQCNAFHQASIAVYKRWNPKYGMYGIGYHSVLTMFDTISNNPRSKYHSPD